MKIGEKFIEPTILKETVEREVIWMNNGGETDLDEDTSGRRDDLIVSAPFIFSFFPLLCLSVLYDSWLWARRKAKNPEGIKFDLRLLLAFVFLPSAFLSPSLPSPPFPSVRHWKNDKWKSLFSYAQLKLGNCHDFFNVFFFFIFDIRKKNY